jgi:bacterioferritin-associated ferredoxin
MYVCLCRAVTDKEIKEKSKASRCPTADLLKKLGVGIDCGACLRQAEEVASEGQVPQAARTNRQKS